MAEYIAWDYSRPGISFRIGSGRIGIFKKTLEAMGCPEYFRFLFSPEDMRTCGWDQKVSYRIAGEVHGRMVYFDLDKAYEIHEGRVLEVSDEKKHQKTTTSAPPSVTPS